VLTIVHRRDDARLLCELLPDDTLHLSAAMCPHHRTELLNEVRRRLKANERCRVVATQLVEAGVDLDFPVVFRAFAGLDSLAQAAGRCNREGRAGRGRLEIFVAETAPPPGELRTALDAGRIIAGKRGGKPDLFSDPSLFTDYFLQFYGTPADVKGIQTDRASYHFATVAENFRMIENGQEPLIVLFDERCRELLRRLEAGDGNQRLLRRRLQRYAVSVPQGLMKQMREVGAAVETAAGNGIFVLADLYSSVYHPRFGLVQSRRFAIDPERLIS
jgi:CRISPR-associated endonuclease/helicase Cas3